MSHPLLLTKKEVACLVLRGLMVHSPMGPPVDLNLYRLRVAAPPIVFFPRIGKSTTLGHLDDLAVLPALLWTGDS